MGDCWGHRAEALEGFPLPVNGLSAPGGSLFEWAHRCSLASWSHTGPGKTHQPRAVCSLPATHAKPSSQPPPCSALFAAAAEGMGLR